MRVFRAVTLLGIAALLGGVSLWWLVTLQLAHVPTARDSADPYALGYTIGQWIATLLPAALSGFALRGGLRQLRNH